MALTVAMALIAGAAQAAFAPKFTVELSDTKKLGNPALTFHLEFAEDDEEIGQFTGFIPKGFNIAGDDAIPPVMDEAGREKGEEIGSGTITIAAGPGCRGSAPGGQIPFKTNATIDATFYERSRNADEMDAVPPVHAVWFLDLEPLNRVRLRVTGSPLTGWTVSGAPDPSDNTCNPLVADLTINATSESGVKIITNPKKPGKKKFMADISSQDSPAIAHFDQIITITK
jgi:hypothetical protein